ncbi:Wzz/FepE/Etk N-terminal domain-containing protein, partial [Chloroflexota bacterium]
MTIYDDEIDLRPYIDAILKNWWKIGLLAISLAVFVFIYTRMQAPSYQTTATVLVPHSQLKLSLANQFPTIVNAEDTRSRMDAYLAIARSDAIASQTYQALEDTLPEGYTITILQSSVEITNTGDAIQITAAAPTTELAAEIANEWAFQTVQAINLAYSGEQPLEEIQNQILAAAETYQAAQIALESFIENNLATNIQASLDLAKTNLDLYLNDRAWQIGYLYHQQQQSTQISDQ